MHAITQADEMKAPSSPPTHERDARCDAFIWVTPPKDPRETNLPNAGTTAPPPPRHISSSPAVMPRGARARF